MNKRSISLIGPSIGLAATLLSTTAFSEPVTLTTADGQISIAGEIIAYDGELYVIQTELGPMNVRGAMVSCTGAACPSRGEPSGPSSFAFAGSRALAEGLIPALVSQYSGTLDRDVVVANSQEGGVTYSLENSQFGPTEIVIAPSSTRDGFEALLNGDAQFALATRPARNREIRTFFDSGKGNLRSASQERIVAVDGLVLVTHPNNPVRAITELNAAFAFGGRVDNWTDLGGRDAPINLYVRGADSGNREVFDNLLMRPNGLVVTDNVTVLASDAEIVSAVQNDPNGLGFTSFAASADAAALDIEGVCGLRTPANAFTIKTEEYPLTRLLYMYQTNDGLDFQAQGFLDYLRSDAAQAVIEEAGFVDQRISDETINSQGIRVASAVIANAAPEEYLELRNLMELLLASDRLSTTFRFETGSARLDARAQADVTRLADLLSGTEFANKEILFVGFTDSVGRGDLNKTLSEQRAALVLQTVLDANPGLAAQSQLRAVGFGEVSPLGCNETDTGRRINRRVEVWVQDIAAQNR